jgi:chemotaxis protein MotB
MRKKTFMGVLGIVVSLLAVGCTGELEEQNADLRRQLEQLQSEHDTTLARLAELQSENEQMMGQLNEAGANFESLEEARNSCARQLEEARAREAAQQARLASFRRVIEQFRALVESGQLRVRIVRGQMVVELPEGILFDSARADLKEDGEATLEQVAGVLASIENRRFLIAGHTDNIPIRSRRFRSNWELSAARGVEVAKFLAEHGVSPANLGAAGYADTQPLNDNSTPELRAQNRRIEIVIMPNLDELPDLSQLEGDLEG